MTKSGLIVVAECRGLYAAKQHNTEYDHWAYLAVNILFKKCFLLILRSYDTTYHCRTLGAMGADPVMTSRMLPPSNFLIFLNIR